jgi:hypothetical protein
LDEAVEAAVRNSRNIANAKLEAARAGDRIAQTRTRRSPSLNFYGLSSLQLQPFEFTFSKGLFGTYPGVGPIPQDDVQARTPIKPTIFIVGRAVQPLTSLYRIGLNLRTLETGVKLAGEEERARRQEVVRDVKRIY